MRRSLLLTAMVMLATGAAGQAPKPATTSSVEPYRRLANAGLDSGRTFALRDAGLDREDIHLSFTEGTISFTEAVDGKITGAFFEGEGEILLVPPNQMERGSLALFTKSAVLEERFTAAYLRFSDDFFKDLQPYLRPAEGPQRFVERWQSAARSLALTDALRLLVSFVNQNKDDRFLHARLIGRHLGTFDVFLDNRAGEQISVAQAGVGPNGGRFYDIWTAFPMRSARSATNLDLKSREPFQILATRIQARVSPPRELSADAEVTLQTNREGERMLLFELSRYLQVKSVLMEQAGQEAAVPAEFIQNEALEGSELARRGNDLIGVVLPRTPVAGEKLVLRFSYNGPVLSEAGGGLMYVGARGTWYPNRGPAMGQFDLEFRYPGNWTLVATGKRVSQQADGGDQVARWVSERPIPLAGFNLGQYVTTRTEVQQAEGNVEVDTYASRGLESALQTLPPAAEPIIVPRVAGRRDRFPLGSVQTPMMPSPAGGIKGLGQRAAGTIDYLSGRIGPFPYSTLSLTQMPGAASQGWPGLVFLSSYAFVVESAANKFDPLNRVLFAHVVPAHEIAHQWWGDSVLWKSYRDQWLVEALSNYCALMELEAANPASFDMVMEHYRQNQLREGASKLPYREAGPVSLGMRLTSSKFPDGYEVVTYGRGTWIIHMLRSMLRDASAMPRARTAHRAADKSASATQPSGDELFLKILRNLQQRLRGGDMEARDLQQAFEEVLPEDLRFEGKKSLDWFFEEWVNGSAVPRLRLREVTLAKKGTATVASGKLLQEDAPESLVTSVPIYAAGAGDQLTLAARVFADGSETSFHFRAPPGTRKLVIDPYQTVLSRP